MLRSLPFKPALFAKVLAVILALVAVVCFLVVWRQGFIALRDVVGSLLSAVLGAYLVHLWLLPPHE